MRHVIVGAQSPIGSSVIRLLGSLNLQNIVAVSPTGTIPEGVDPKKVVAHFGDVLDPYTIYEILEEDDIVYNCQIVSEETADPDEARSYNTTGVANILGISSLKGVRRVVCAFPQALGYHYEKEATESDFGLSPSPIQLSLIEGISIIERYSDGEDFGWDFEIFKSLTGGSEEVELVEESQNLKTSPNMKAASSGPSLKATPSGPNMKSGPSPGPNVKSAPNMKSGPSLGPNVKSTPNMKSGPSLGNLKQTPVAEEEGVEQEVVEKGSEPAEESVSEGTSTEDLDTVEPPTEPEPEVEPEMDLDRVMVVVARVAKLFGPFDEEFTAHFCKSIRLQRIVVVGKNDKEITWINPIDAGRAMIVLAETDLEEKSKHYLINGFKASPLQLLEELDRVNHSKVKIAKQPLFPKYIRHLLVSAINKLGLKVKDRYYIFKQYTVAQVFDDSLAKEALNWSPRYDLERSAKDAMNWYISHQV